MSAVLSCCMQSCLRSYTFYSVGKRNFFKRPLLLLYLKEIVFFFVGCMWGLLNPCYIHAKFMMGQHYGFVLWDNHKFIQNHVCSLNFVLKKFNSTIPIFSICLNSVGNFISLRK